MDTNKLKELMETFLFDYKSEPAQKKNINTFCSHFTAMDTSEWVTTCNYMEKNISNFRLNFFKFLNTYSFAISKKISNAKHAKNFTVFSYWYLHLNPPFNDNGDLRTSVKVIVHPYQLDSITQQMFQINRDDLNTQSIYLEALSHLKSNSVIKTLLNTSLHKTILAPDYVQQYRKTLEVLRQGQELLRSNNKLKKIK